MTVIVLSLEDKQLLNKAYTKLNEANGVLQFLGQHFQEKYQLTPNHYITPDGEVHEREGMTINGQMEETEVPV